MAQNLNNKLMLIHRLAYQKKAIFQINTDWTNDKVVYEWRVEGPRGLNNANCGYSSIEDAIDDMLDWLASAQEKPYPEKL